MRIGRIILGWCLVNYFLELGKKVFFRRNFYVYFFYVYYSDNDLRVVDFLEMSV